MGILGQNLSEAIEKQQATNSIKGKSMSSGVGIKYKYHDLQLGKSGEIQEWQERKYLRTQWFIVSSN